MDFSICLYQSKIKIRLSPSFECIFLIKKIVLKRREMKVLVRLFHSFFWVQMADNYEKEDQLEMI